MSKKIKTGNTGLQLKKNDITFFLVLSSVLYLILTYIVMHIATAMFLNPNETLFNTIPYGFSHLISNPIDLIINSDTMKTLGVITLIYIFLMMYFRIEFNKRKHDAKGKEKGTSKWNDDYNQYNKEMSDPKFSSKNDGDYNMILSENIRLNLDTRETLRNNNVIVFGGSGTGKSRFVIKPNLLECNTSYVITDPSGELLESVGPTLRDAGYKIKVFNLVQMQHSDSFNPLKYIRNDEGVLMLVKCIMKNTQDPNTKGDQFFDAATEALLQAIIFLLYKRYPKDASLSKVMELINLAEVDEDNPNAKSRLDLLFEKEHEEYPDSIAYKQYSIYKKGTGKTLKSILISTGVRLTAFNIEGVKRLTSSDSIHLEDFGSEKVAMFVIIPTADDTYNFLVSMMYSVLFELLYFNAENICPNRFNICTSRSCLKKNDNKKSWQFWKPQYIKSQKQGRILSSHDSKEDAKNFMQNVKKAKYRDGTIYYIDNKKQECVLKTFDTGDIKTDNILCQEWISAFSNAKIYNGEKRLPEHVRFMLDEFANIGEIPNFEKKLATMRKYEISCTIIYQSLSQLKKMYDKDWGNIVDNCDSLIFLGGQGTETAEMICKKLGNATITVKGTSVSEGRRGDSSSYNASDRALATETELIQMANEDCLVFVRSINPFNEKKYDYPKHPKYHTTGDANSSKKINIQKTYNITDNNCTNIDEVEIIEEKQHEKVQKSELKGLKEDRELEEKHLAKKINPQILQAENMDTQEKINKKIEQYNLAETENDEDEVFFTTS